MGKIEARKKEVTEREGTRSWIWGRQGKAGSGEGAGSVNMGSEREEGRNDEGRKETRKGRREGGGRESREGGVTLRCKMFKYDVCKRRNGK